MADIDRSKTKSPVVRQRERPNYVPDSVYKTSSFEKHLNLAECEITYTVSF